MNLRRCHNRCSHLRNRHHTWNHCRSCSRSQCCSRRRNSHTHCRRLSRRMSRWSFRSRCCCRCRKSRRRCRRRVVTSRILQWRRKKNRNWQCHSWGCTPHGAEYHGRHESDYDQGVRIFATYRLRRNTALEYLSEGSESPWSHYCFHHYRHWVGQCFGISRRCCGRNSFGWWSAARSARPPLARQRKLWL